MGVVQNERAYRLLETRPRVLVNSLLRSRENWKAKCRESKVELQTFRGRVRDLEQSREKWRAQAEKSESELKNLTLQLDQSQEKCKQLEEQVAALEAAKKKNVRR